MAENSSGGTGFFGRVWNDIKGFVGRSKSTASGGFFHDINKKKNEALEAADAEVDGRKMYTDADSYGTSSGGSDSMDPVYSGSSSPTYKRKKRTDSSN